MFIQTWYRRQTGISRNTLKKYLKEYAASGLTGDVLLKLSEKELEKLFIKPDEKPLSSVQQTLFALFPDFDKELKQKGVTQQILWIQ